MSEYHTMKKKRRNLSNTRERHISRQRRQQTMASLHEQTSSKLSRAVDTIASTTPKSIDIPLATTRNILLHSLQNIPVMKALAGGIVVIIIWFFATYLLGGRIFPNVWAMNIPLGGLTIEEATERLNDNWFDGMQVELVANGETIMSASPLELGLRLDAGATAEKAKSVSVTSIPFGISIEPIIDVDYGTVQDFLLNHVDERVYLPPYEAGYRWQDGQVVGVNGRSSRELDIPLTIERFSQNPTRVTKNRRLELVTTSTPPAVIDPSPYLNDAQTLITRGFQLIGYDPFTNETIPWTTTEEEITNWLIAAENGLALREDAFRSFIRALNRALNSEEGGRYIDENEAFEYASRAVAGEDTSAFLRIRYLPTSYEVLAGDTGYGIGWKKGMPYLLVLNENPSVEWDSLSIGTTVQIPSRDILITQEVVPHKRIVVDLENLWLVAFENGEIVFNWQISDGRPSAPSFPGVYQILLKEDIASGSSFSLCNENNECGQWRMHWFMGMYEVVPGLMNGFHGAVELPNGGYLGGGVTGLHTTFGCVMSENSQAKMLYDWAEVGTMVEIFARDYPPESEIGRQAQEFIHQTIRLNNNARTT